MTAPTEVKNLTLAEVAQTGQGNVADGLFAIADALNLLVSAIDTHGETVGGATEGAFEPFDKLVDRIESHTEAMEGIGKAVRDLAHNGRLYGRVA